jgi:hypothetical protein
MATTDAHRPSSTTFPSRIGDHAPNLATLDELRSRGRNPLLTPVHRGRHRSTSTAATGCTAR